MPWAVSADYATPKPRPHPEELAKQASRRMDTTPGLAAILRDARKGALLRMRWEICFTTAKAGDPINAGVSISHKRCGLLDAPAFAGHDDGSGCAPGNDAYSFFFTTRNVALARAMAAPSAVTKHCAKQSVPPVLMTSVSTVSHCPIWALLMKSIDMLTVTSEWAPRIL